MAITTAFDQGLSGIYIELNSELAHCIEGGATKTETEMTSGLSSQIYTEITCFGLGFSGQAQ